MKPYCGLVFVCCIVAGSYVLAQRGDEEVISLTDIVEAHKEPVRVESTMVEMELSNCILTVVERPINACQILPGVGSRKITMTYDLRDIWRMRISNLDMPGTDNLNSNRNMLSVSGIDPNNSNAFSQEFEKCDGTTNLVENGTGFGFSITAVSDGFFRDLPIEFDSAGCLTEAS